MRVAASSAGTSSSAATGPIIVVGIAAGFLAGLFGVGGGLLVVPALVMTTSMSQRMAHGTSLAAVVPISLASLVSYVAHGNVDWTVTLWLAAGAVGGAVIGTKLLHVLPHRTLGLLFSVILVASAVRLFIATAADGRDELTVLGVVALVAIGVATGIVAGLLGVGGGIIMVPAMILLFAIPPVIAKGTSAAVIVPTALMGTWRNRRTGNADMRVAVIVGLAGIVTAIIGGFLADKMSDDLSNVLFATLLGLVAARLLWQLERERRQGPPSEEVAAVP